MIVINIARVKLPCSVENSPAVVPHVSCEGKSTYADEKPPASHTVGVLSPDHCSSSTSMRRDPIVPLCLTVIVVPGVREAHIVSPCLASQLCPVVVAPVGYTNCNRSPACDCEYSHLQKQSTVHFKSTLTDSVSVRLYCSTLPLYRLTRYPCTLQLMLYSSRRSLCAAGALCRQS